MVVDVDVVHAGGQGAVTEVGGAVGVIGPLEVNSGGAVHLDHDVLCGGGRGMGMLVVICLSVSSFEKASTCTI